MVVFANGKGGVAKTTSALGVAASLARGRHVVVVDLDPEGFATVMGLGQRISRDQFSSTPVAVSHAALGGAGSLRLIPSSVNLHLLSEDAIIRRLEYARSVADLVVVDTPPHRLTPAVRGALRVATTIVVPVVPEFQALAGWYRILEETERIGAIAPVRALRCRWESRTRLATDVAAELTERHPDAVLPTIVPRDQRAAEACSKGIPVTLFAPRCRAAQSYHLAAMDIAATLNPYPLEMKP